MKVKPFLNQALTRISKDVVKTSGAPGTKNPIIRRPDYPLPGEKEAEAILYGARDEIIRDGVYNWRTAECEMAELDINKTYKAILNGGRDFAALREACARWVLVARMNPRVATAEQSTLPTGEGQGKP